MTGGYGLSSGCSAQGAAVGRAQLYEMDCDGGADAQAKHSGAPHMASWHDFYRLMMLLRPGRNEDKTEKKVEMRTRLYEAMLFRLFDVRKQLMNRLIGFR